MIRPLNCRETVARLMDYLEGRLPSRQRRALDAHLDECPRCREFLDSYRATPVIVRRATVVSLPAGVATRLRKALRRCHD